MEGRRQAGRGWTDGASGCGVLDVAHDPGIEKTL